MELQLVNMLLLTLLRCSQSITNFGYIARLIPGFCGLFQYKILSLILKYTLLLSESNVEGQNQRECKGVQRIESIKLAVLVGKRAVMIKGLVEINQYRMEGGSEPEIERSMIHYQIAYQTAQRLTFKLIINSKLKWHFTISDFHRDYLLLNECKLC